MLKIFTKKFWLRVDRNANAEVFEGDREETMSSRMGRMLFKGDRGFLGWRIATCKVLSWIEKLFTDRKDNVKHCKESVKD
jgi:hypothetical protein